MAYSELIKNFQRIRSYMSEFYIYGFKSREEYDKKSPRSYDNERRRIENYLGEYMGFRQTPSGKQVFLSIDSRRVKRNPLYRAWKAKSFTDGDITLHFILFDILYSPEIELSIPELLRKMDEEYLSCFESPMLFDESTLRKKCREYVKLGILSFKKQGKRVLYKRNGDVSLAGWQDALEYFSETGMCGVIGSYLLDKQKQPPQSMFSFKHHYITHVLESEVLCSLFQAISEKRTVFLENAEKNNSSAGKTEITPLQIYISVQSGRRYVFGYHKKRKQITSYRLDRISKVETGMLAKDFDVLREEFLVVRKHMWGVSLRGYPHTEHVEFTVEIGQGEEHIYNRLVREKRCGIVEWAESGLCRFTADVYDTGELIPWIRTFICRLKSLDFSNRTWENRFRRDVEELYRMYGIGESMLSGKLRADGGNSHVVS